MVNTCVYGGEGVVVPVVQTEGTHKVLSSCSSTSDGGEGDIESGSIFGKARWEWERLSLSRFAVPRHLSSK